MMRAKRNRGDGNPRIDPNALTVDELAAAKKLAAALASRVLYVTAPDGSGEFGASAADQIQQFAEMMDRATRGAPTYHGTLARAGVWFTGYLDPDAWPDRLRTWARTARPEAQQCFYNSFKLVALGPAAELGLRYFEGQVFLPSVGFGIEHAWLGAACGGPAVDLTLPVVDARHGQAERGKLNRAGAVYRGVEVPGSFVTRATVADRIAAPRLPQWIAAVLESSARDG